MVLLAFLVKEVKGTKRLGQSRVGRTILRIYQHNEVILDRVVRSSTGVILTTGRAMDYAARLRGYGSQLTPEVALEFARLTGISTADLRLLILPSLKAAGVIDYATRGNDLIFIEEYVGVAAPLLDQVVAILTFLDPSDTERCLLHSVELGTWAPLTLRQHLDYLIMQGYTEQVAREAVTLSLSIGVNKRSSAPQLSDDIIYSPYVWTSSVVDIAAFLRSLPPNERDVILGVCEAASLRPGLALPKMRAFNPNVIRGARKVGLLQAATVISTTDVTSRQTYVFSPLLESRDNMLRTTEALHERKLFVAHILFGHEMALQKGGRIRDPVVLVNALLHRGQVGPAPNIGRDYHLLEASGIVRVAHSTSGPMMVMVKQDIVSDSLRLLEQTLGAPEWSSGSTATLTSLLKPPSEFVSPERDRQAIGEDAATMEVLNAAVHRLREEAQRAARHENPFA